MPLTERRLPELPREISEFPIADRPNRSRFFSLFSRKRPDKEPKDPITVNKAVPSDAVIPASRPVSKHQSTSPKPPPTRSRSTTWSSRTFKSSTKPPKVERPRGVTTWDPPPLFQATSQAILQETLDVPSSFAEAVFKNSPTRPSSGSSDGSLVARTSFDRPKTSHSRLENRERVHKRNISNSSTCSLTQKIFILMDWGYVLQYSADGSMDRLPEKVLELGPGSVAIASDALPGKHWVLRISQDGKAEGLQTQTPKSSWSKMPFRSTEIKRVVKDFLLVFESAKAFDAWLTAIRKEIEALGGLEYRPDSRGEALHRRPTGRLTTHKLLGTSARSTPDLHATALEQLRGLPSVPPMPESPKLPLLSHTLIPRKSIASSSVNTNTDLERMQRSSFSDSNSMATTTGTSFDGSTSGSPAQDSFPRNIMQKHGASKSTSGLKARKSISRIKGSNLVPVPRIDVGQSHEPSLLGSFQFPRSPTKITALPHVPTLGSETVDSNVTSKSILSTSSMPVLEPHYNMPPSSQRKASETDVPDRPVSTIAPLPMPGTLKKANSRYRKENAPTQEQLSALISPTISLTGSTSSRPASSHSKSGSGDSTTQRGPRRTSSYSLFPKRCSSLEYGQGNSSPAPSPLLPSPGLTITSSNNDGFPFPEVAETVPKLNDDSASRPHSRRIHRKQLSIETGHDTAAIDIRHKPQRSPAVTEAHLSSNFGLETSFPAARYESTQESDGPPVSITTTTIEMPVITSDTTLESQVPKLSLPPKKERRVSPQRSTPNLLYSAVPPLGPPPSGPLPAVPVGLALASPGPRGLQAHHARGKSSVSSVGSQSSLGMRVHQKQYHHRTISSVSSAGSLNSSRPPSAPVSPSKIRHQRKLPSVSSVGSLGSVSGWIPSAESTLPPSPTTSNMTHGASPTSGMTPATPRFPSGGGVIGKPPPKSRFSSDVQSRPNTGHRDGIIVASPGTAY